MKYFFLAVALFFTATVFSQENVKLEEVKSHIGDSIASRGKVFGVRYFPDAKNAPTLINIGGAFPNQLLTVVITGDIRKEMPFQPTEEFLKEKEVIIRGKIELYKGKPQIVVSHLSQFQIVDGKEVLLSN